MSAPRPAGPPRAPARSRKSGAGRRRGRSGFSLLELLLVLTIVLLLATLALTGGPGAQRRREMAGCRNNLLSIHQALSTYAMDHAGAYPAAKTERSEVPLSLLVPRDTTRTEIFICPGTSLRKPPQAAPFADRRISYSYAMGLSRDAPAEQWLAADEQVNALPKKPGEPLFSSGGSGRGANHGARGGNLVFADGHTDFSPAASAFVIGAPPGGAVLNP